MTLDLCIRKLHCCTNMRIICFGMALSEIPPDLPVGEALCGPLHTPQYQFPSVPILEAQARLNQHCYNPSLWALHAFAECVDASRFWCAMGGVGGSWGHRSWGERWAFGCSRGEPSSTKCLLFGCVSNRGFESRQHALDEWNVQLRFGTR